MLHAGRATGTYRCESNMDVLFVAELLPPNFSHIVATCYPFILSFDNWLIQLLIQSRRGGIVIEITRQKKFKLR